MIFFSRPYIYALFPHYNIKVATKRSLLVALYGYCIVRFFIYLQLWTVYVKYFPIYISPIAVLLKKIHSKERNCCLI